LQCITEGLTKGIQKVGESFASGEYFLPELIVGADAMKAALDILEPALVGDQKREVVGTMLTANGFQVVDIGVDKTAAEFIEAVKESDATKVGASALLTTTMLQQETLINALKEAGLRDQLKVMVGGAPVTDSFTKQIGADGYAEDAISAVDLAMRLADAPA
jgi:methylmalonyl-CoA mutase cobalamin-binding domain/chain